MRITALSICSILLLIVSAVQAQRGEREVLKINVTASDDPAQIELSWESISGANSYRIYKRSSFDTAFSTTPIKTNMPMDTVFVDTDVEIGKGYEYYIATNTSSTTKRTYVYSGIKKEAESSMGSILLLIDENYRQPLSFELDRLESDLQNEGWNVLKEYIPRNMSPKDVKPKISQAAQQVSNKLNSIFIVGHVPVPYSGNYGGSGDLPPPDGHVVGSGGHTGAWSADTYYACFGGAWTDSRVTNTTGSRSRNHNTIGDGVFDQSRLPGNVEYEIGRVDLFDMPEFSKSDTELVRDYLNRNHLYRTGVTKTVERAVIDDNFNGLNLSSTGWHNFNALYTADSISTEDYFTAMKAAPYQWSYGCGAGSYVSCNGVGRTSDFAADSLQSIFTILAGSYFGDWDIKNNLLRAPLANSALVSFWGGIPKWYIHTMALGKNIGFGTRESMNNRGEYFTGNFNSSYNSAHMALMGDPSLKQSYIQGPKNGSATSADNNVSLTWEASLEDVDGYYVYELDQFEGSNYKRSEELLTELNFVDSNKRTEGLLQYMVRAVKYDTTNSGTYEVLSPALFVEVDHSFDFYLGNEATDVLSQVKVYPNPAKSYLNVVLAKVPEENVTLRLTTITGNTVYSSDIIGRTQHLIETAELAQGLYTLQLKSARSTQNMSISIVR